MAGQMQRIRDYYDVPAKRGMTVLFRGEPVRIVSAGRSGGMYLSAQTREGGTLILHPTWEIEYPDEQHRL